MKARTFTPLGIFGLYVAGHVYCRTKKWHLTRGYIERDESTIEPDFKFDNDFTAKLQSHVGQNASP